MDNKPIIHTKTEFIQSLENTLLVIGNGFDLHCGLKSKYSDYFEHDKEKNEKLANWANSCTRDYAAPFQIFVKQNHWNQEAKALSRSLPPVDDLNVWDLAFYFISFEDKERNAKRWCDIEEAMGRMLRSCFPTIFQLLDPKQRITSPNAYLLEMAAFIHKKNKGFYFADINQFYDFLLRELKLFERNFGLYINDQINGASAKASVGIESSETYESACEKTISKLCSPENLVEIDTFNYGHLPLKRFEDILRHINGDINNPIFGIDSNGIGPNAPERIFTKTYRRMDSDAQIIEFHECRPFQNAIVFGHSLCKSDYSYFFPLLDQLNIADANGTSKIVFAYYVYDQNRTNEIKSAFLKGVSTLFKEYAESKGKKDPERLIDLLRAQERVHIYELESLGND